MNDILAKTIDEHVPKFTKEVVDGLATTYIPQAPRFIEEVVKNAMKSATPLLEYRGWREATPEETVAAMMGAKNTVSKIDMSRSDVYLILLFFRYDGVDLPPSKLLVPFVGEGGTMHISGTKYHNVPVLTDTVISPTKDMVFVRLHRDKLTFDRGMYNILINGRRQVSQVIYSDIYRNSRVDGNRSGITTPIIIYLMAKYGFKETFRKYAGIVVDIIYEKPQQGATVSYTGFDVYSSTKLKPARSKTKVYHGHDAHILAPSDDDIDNEAKEFIENSAAGIIYTFDMYPQFAKDIVSSIVSGKLDEEKRYWTVVLGTLINNDAFTIDLMYGNAVDHLKSVEHYTDSFIRDRLATIDIHIENFFDLLSVILIRYTSWVLTSKTYSNNIMNRYIDILYYVLYEIIVGIHIALLEITRKTERKVQKPTEVNHILTTKLSYRKIFRVTSHLSTMLVDCAGDNKYPKITSILELQELGDGVKKSKNTVIPEAAKSLSASDVSTGSILFVPKRIPSPKVRANPFMTINVATGRFAPTEEMQRTVQALNTLISGVNRKELSASAAELEIDIDTDDNKDLFDD